MIDFNNTPGPVYNKPRGDGDDRYSIGSSQNKGPTAPTLDQNKGSSIAP